MFLLSLNSSLLPSVFVASSPDATRSRRVCRWEKCREKSEEEEEEGAGTADDDDDDGIRVEED